MADRVEIIGIYSAYGFAKEAGYTGTKAEFEQGLKNSAEYADNAASSANAATNAKNAAVTAKTDAQAAQSAAETAQGLAEDAQAAAEGAQSAAEAAAASLDASTIARIDGFYENMGVGTADQLMASQKVNDSDPYIFRTSGGTSDIGNREELEIVGGSVAWNQLITDAVNNLSVVQVTKTVNNGEVTITSTNDSVTVKGAVNDHLCKVGKVYLIGAYFKTDDTSYAAVGFRIGGMPVSAGNNSMMWTNNTSYTYMARIAKLSELVQAGIYVKNDTPSGGSATFKNVQVFDLTALFGSEIADHIYELEQAEAGAGVAWFRKYFTNDYYDYNPGELMHVSDLQSHDTVGFNLLDSDTVLKAIGFTRQSDDSFYVAESSSVLGKKVWKNKTNYSGQICVSYSYKYNSAQNQGARFVFVYTDGTTTDNYAIASTSYSDKTIISSANKTVDYIKLNYGTGSVATWIKDLCINLSWSGTRDGEYEPYVKRSYPLDPSLTLRGIPKLTADGDLTYDGDIYKPDGTVERRYGVVDLGTLTWSTSVSRLFYTDSLTNLAKPAVTSTIAGNILSTNYVTRDTNGMVGPSDSSPSGDKEIGIGMGGRIFVNDFSYTDAETFKAAMSGVYLVYELAEPTTEEAEPYTSPQIVDDWGTEEFVTTSIVPVGHNTSYPANLRDKLQHLPDLPDDDGYYMTQVTGTQMSLVRFRIPQAPAEDGEYILKATVSNGTPTYTWEAVVEAEGGEG